MSVAEALVAVCVEPGCGKAADHMVHRDDNEDGHFFNGGAALLGPRAVAPKPKRRQTSSPDARKKKDHRRCVHCGRERTFHRGPMDHRFEPPSNHAPSPAQILEAVDRALRSIHLAPRLKIGEVTIRPTYAADNDAELLSARVLVDLSLIFPASNPEEGS